LPALLLVPAFVEAQTTGSIEGSVRDPSGAAAPGAIVHILEMHTGVGRNLESGADGRFMALRLAPGLYQISVSRSGFRDLVRRGVELGAGRALHLDFTLELGEARDTVVVSARAPLIDYSASDWGASAGTEQLESLPFNGRDLFALFSQQPGASLSLTADRSFTAGIGLKVSVNGARPNQNGFRLDGIYINDATSSVPASAAGASLGIEGIRELRFVTSPFSAEYGRAAGAVVTAVSRSGSNEFHGSLYEFFRNSALDAKNFFDAPEERTPPLRRNQFGGLAGGPLRKDKLFWLLNYEAVREALSSTVRPVVPTAEAREGLLPEAGGGVRRVAVAPQVGPYLDLYPLPNGRDFGDGTAEFVNEQTRSTREDYGAAKLDYIASERLRFFWRYTFDDAYSSVPDPLRLWRFFSDSRYQFLHAEALRIRSPRTIVTLRAGFSRVRNGEDGDLTRAVPPSLSFVPGQLLGAIEVTGLAELGGTRARLRPRHFALNDFQWNGDAAHVHGRHTLRAGAGYDRIHFNQRADLNAGGRYLFTSLADFLQGRARSADLMLPGSDTIRGWRQHQFHGFLQDEVHFGPALSVGYGLRYEAYSVPGEVNGKVAVLPDPLRDTQAVVGGPLFRNPSRDNFAPRSSLAWDPFGSGKSVFRAGAGVFFELLGPLELVVAGMRVPPLFHRAVLTRPPFPGLWAAAETASPQRASDGLDFYMNQPYTVQFQASFERQAGADTVVRLGYAGVRGVHLMGQIGNANPPRPEVLPGGRLLFPDGPRLNPAFEQIGLRRAQFNSFHYSFTASVARRWSRGLRFQTNYTWGKTLDEVSGVVFSDFSNGDLVPTVFDYRQNRGPADFDVRHLLSGNLSWRIPEASGGGVRHLVRGWELHGLVQAHTGFYFSPSVGFDRARLRPTTGDLGQRPDLARPESVRILGDPQRWFDPEAFSLPPAGFLGNLGRGALGGPGLFVVDVAAHKELWRSEARSLRLRVECFNLLNRPNFDIPSGLRLFSSTLQRLGTAGRITETSTAARQIQLALKWTF